MRRGRLGSALVRLDSAVRLFLQLSSVSIVAPQMQLAEN